MVRSSSRLRSSTGSAVTSTPKAIAAAAADADASSSSSSAKKRGRSRTPIKKQQSQAAADQEQREEESSSKSKMKTTPSTMKTTPSKSKSKTKNITPASSKSKATKAAAATKANKTPPSSSSSSSSSATKTKKVEKRSKRSNQDNTVVLLTTTERRVKGDPTFVAKPVPVVDDVDDNGSSSPLKEKKIKRKNMPASSAKKEVAVACTTASTSTTPKGKKKKRSSSKKNQHKIVAAPVPVPVKTPVPVPVTIFPPNRRESTKSDTSNKFRKTKKVGNQWVANTKKAANDPMMVSTPSPSKKKTTGSSSHDEDENDDEHLPTPPPTIESSTTKMKRKRKRRKSMEPVSEGQEEGVATSTTCTSGTNTASPSKNNNNNNKKKKMKIAATITATKKENNNNTTYMSKKNSSDEKKKKKGSTPTKTKTTTKIIDSSSTSEKDSNSNSNNNNNKFKPTLDARVHRIRHMGYIPGSISAMATSSLSGNKSGKSGEHVVAVARTDGSYELKSIIDSSGNSGSGNDKSSAVAVAPQHRLITIAETPPITGTKSSSLNDDNDNESEEEQSSQQCYDAATSLCWVNPSSSKSSSKSSSPVCVGSGPNGNLWIVNFHKSNPIQSIVSSGGGGIFDLTTCDGNGSSSGISNNLPFVAAACEDGSVRVWRVKSSSSGGENGNEILDPPLVTLPSAGAPVLSLVWKLVHVQQQSSSSSAKKGKSCYKTVIFAAIADGTIRKYGLEIEQTNIGIDGDDNDVFYSVPNLPKSILRMTIENKGRREPTKVWTLCLLNDDNDNTLVSGNSLGQIQFWNSDTGTLTQTVIQSSNQADVLKIIANKDETKLFASGVDSKIVCLERKKIINNNSNNNSRANATDSDDLTALVTSHLTSYRPWKMTISQRPHTHDVKAMSIVSSSSSSLWSNTTNDDDDDAETLLTGGIDTKICSYSVMGFATTQPQSWYPWPCTKSLLSSTTKVIGRIHPKLLSMQRYDSIELYQLSTLKDYKRKRTGIQTLSAEESHRATLAQHPTSIPVGTIRLGGDKEDDDDDDDDDNMMISSSTSTRMQASLLSPDGKFLAVSNATSTYVFHLKQAGENEDGSVRLEPMKLHLPSVVQNVSATVFQFVGDDLYVGNSDNRKVHIVRLKTDATVNKKDKDRMDVDDDDDDDTTSSTMFMHSVSLPESQPNSNNDNNCAISLPIQSIHSSEDGKFMVTMSRTQENAIHIFYRKNKKSLYEHYWTLPSLGSANDSRPAAIAIVDGNKLAVATYQSHLYLFDIESKSLNEWSEQNGFPIKDNKWTGNSLCGRGYPLRLIPLQQQKDRIIMASFGTFCVIDLNKSMPRDCRIVPKRRKRRNRRKYQAIVHEDDDEDDEDDNEKELWLEPRVTKVVEDEYSHCDADGDDNDTQMKQVAKKSSLSVKTTAANTQSIIPNEVSDEEITTRNCTIVSHYKNMLYTEFLGPKEMVVVEQPWLDVAETFPAALQRRIYGAD